jgi:hypothetical protein
MPTRSTPQLSEEILAVIQGVNAFEFNAMVRPTQPENG